MAADERYVIGIDASTQAVKAIAWTANGTPRAEGRAPLTISEPAPRHAEQNAQDWWSAASVALRAVTRAIGADRVDGVAISNQRETMVLLDANRRPLAPATLWLDRRAHEVVSVLAREIGPERLHRISGKPVDVIPCIYRLRHLRDTDPGLLDRAAQILSVHDVLVQELCGEAVASWTSADPFGLLDIDSKEWSRPLLNHLGIPVERFPVLAPPGAEIGQIGAQAARATGLQAGTRVFAAGGDGQCAGLGVGALETGVVYANLGTAIVGGVWSRDAALSRDWRTLVSPDGVGYLLESVQRGGAYFINWLLETFSTGRSDPAIFARLEREAGSLPIGADGVTVSPYLLGCMNPHWDETARAAITGLGPETGLAHVYRASMEAVTLEFVRSLGAMRRAGAATDRIFVIGGGAGSRLWLQMFADASGLPVIRSLSNEASALGAGISAAVGAGWYGNFRSAARGMSRLAEEIEPRPGQRGQWDTLSVRQEKLYPALAAIN